MSNETAFLFMIMTIGGTGLFIMITGFLILIFEKHKKKNCTATAEGVVVKYSFSNNTPAPIVEYEVEGIKYRKKRYFRGVVRKTKQLSFKDFDQKNNSIYIDEKDVIHINSGVIMNLRKEAERMYPIGSTLTVFYSPKKPKQAYVEKIPSKSSILGIIYIWVGLGNIALSIIISMLVR